MKKLSLLNRRIFILACFCSFIYVVAAQEVSTSDLSVIRAGSKINLVMDFSKSTIMGMNESDFSNYEKDWNEDKPTIISRFQKGLSSRLGKVLKVGTYSDASYTLKVEVTNISDIGNISCDAIITDNKGNILFNIKNVNGGKEPPILPGTKLAKIKIWATLTGRALGGIIRNEYLNQED